MDFDPAPEGHLDAGIVIAIAGIETRSRHFTGEELQVKFLWDSEENSLKY